jgi:hypothetical protein
MAETNNNVPFDPVAVRAKIAEMRRQTKGLEVLLESYGFPIEVEGGYDGTRPPKLRIRVRRRRRTAPLHPIPKKDATVADVAVSVLTELHGRAHGSQIVEGLKRRGMLTKVQHPGSSVSTALSRDKRFVKDPSAPNTWTLSKEIYREG